VLVGSIMALLKEVKYGTYRLVSKTMARVAWYCPDRRTVIRALAGRAYTPGRASNTLMKSTLDTAPPPSTLPRELESQRRAWLAQQKMEWLERKRTVWEADGKLVPWVE
jgi:hypothetical protein